MNSVNCVKVACAAISAAVLGTAGTSVQAFKPDYEAYGHTMISKSVLNSGYQFGRRASGTVYSVDPYRYTPQTGLSVPVAPTLTAIYHIVNGVQSRDGGIVDATIHVGSDPSCTPFTPFQLPYFGLNNPRASGVLVTASADGFAGTKFCISLDLDDPDGHFDNDNFEGSRRSIREHVRLAIFYAGTAVTFADSGDAASAASLQVASRVMLGKAVHTLQDFYAHSNWAETHPDESLATLWTDNLLSNVDALTSSESSQLAAPSLTKQGISVAGGGTGIGDSCEGFDKLKFKETWDDNDGNHTLTNLTITSAAWWPSLLYADGARAAASDVSGRVRCDHGVTDTNTLVAVKKFSGIAKDMPNWPLHPAPQGKITKSSEPAYDDYALEGLFQTWPSNVTTAKQRAEADATDIHLLASFLAAKHTRLLFERVEAAIQSTAGSQYSSDRKLNVLFGGDKIAPEIGWVVDRSGTMYDLLPAIRTHIDSSLRDGVRHILVDYNADASTIGTEHFVGTTGAPAAIRSRLTTMQAGGGTACRSPIWGAVEVALSAMHTPGVLTVFSDASASDGNKQAAVTAVANEKGIKLIFVITGSCSPVDASFAAGAASSNGAMVITEHSADGVVAAGATANAAVDAPRTIHSESAVLNGTKAVPFPVETGASKLTIIVSGAVNAVSVTQPSGAPLAAGAGVTVASVLNGYIYVVTNPQPGNWLVFNCINKR